MDDKRVKLRLSIVGEILSLWRKGIQDRESTCRTVVETVKKFFPDEDIDEERLMEEANNAWAKTMETFDTCIDPNDNYAISKAMIDHGGSFVKILGRLLLNADQENTKKIKATWPDYWFRYKDIARKKGYYGD